MTSVSESGKWSNTRIEAMKFNWARQTKINIAKYIGSLELFNDPGSAISSRFSMGNIEHTKVDVNDPFIAFLTDASKHLPLSELDVYFTKNPFKDVYFTFAVTILDTANCSPRTRGKMIFTSMMRKRTKWDSSKPFSTSVANDFVFGTEHRKMGQPFTLVRPIYKMMEAIQSKEGAVYRDDSSFNTGDKDRHIVTAYDLFEYDTWMDAEAISMYLKDVETAKLVHA